MTQPAAAQTQTQTRFQLPIADDVRLVSVETARAVRGITAEEIFEQVEDHASADHLPAFDLSCRPGAPTRRRELRIWAGALRTAGWRQRSTAPQLLESIIADCLLTNQAGLPNPNIHLHNSQLERAWCVSNDLMIDLIRAGAIQGVRVGRNWRVNRFSAAAFLRRRAQ
jgi:hypothetical protein